MKSLSKIALTVALVAGMSAVAQAQISYTGGTYTQDFDIAGQHRDAVHVVPAGWVVC